VPVSGFSKVSVTLTVTFSPSAVCFRAVPYAEHIEGPCHEIDSETYAPVTDAKAELWRPRAFQFDDIADAGHGVTLDGVEDLSGDLGIQPAEVHAGARGENNIHPPNSWRI